MKVAIYIRVSTTEQAEEGFSLAAQEKSLVKWCCDHENEVYNVYADEGISAKDITHRPQFLQLMEDAQDKKFELVLVWALSRFTRSVSDLYNTLDTLLHLDISFVSLTESFDTTSAMGRAMIGICGIFAQLERELVGERVSAAMAERAAQGKPTTCDVLGYDFKDNCLTINPHETAIVIYIFRKYKEHRSLSAVAELCTLKGYHGKRGGVFKPESIRRILTRPIYVGYNLYKGSLYKGSHPPLININDFNIVQRLLNRSKVGRKGAYYIALK